MNVQDFGIIRQQTFQKVPSMWRGAFWQGIRQYGGESKKKLSARLFKEMLFEVHNTLNTTQGIALEEKFELWQGKANRRCTFGRCEAILISSE